MLGVRKTGGRENVYREIRWESLESGALTRWGVDIPKREFEEGVAACVHLHTISAVSF